MRVPMVEGEDGSYGPDLPDGFRGRATLTPEGDYLLTPDDQAERVDALEAKVAAAEALADKASATAQEVASAMRDAAPGRNR